MFGDPLRDVDEFREKDNIGVHVSQKRRVRRSPRDIENIAQERRPRFVAPDLPDIADAQPVRRLADARIVADQDDIDVVLPKSNCRYGLLSFSQGTARPQWPAAAALRTQNDAK